MIVYRKLEDVPAGIKTVLSAGNFDGVHRGHQHVLAKVVQRAKSLGASSMVLTFEPHPVRILHPDVPKRLLTPLPVKLRLLEKCGLDAVLVLPFTRDLSIMPARDFTEDILASRLHVLEIHEGSNFRFGHSAEGNVEMLRRFGCELGFPVEVYPQESYRGELVSSSRIRELVSLGLIERARGLLARPFSIVSTAGRGRGYGHRYTVPTINLARYAEQIPAFGVYVTWTRVGAECFKAVTNVGNRPTFGEDSFAVESHLLDFHPLTLTPETEIEIVFLLRLRDEIKFPSVDELRAQIGRDVLQSERYFRMVAAQQRPSPKQSLQD
ncbi:MAG: bifunctional riboflavin kinase/FAD synthetase [Terriglobales bacterium]